MESMKKATAKKPHLGLPESVLALGNALVISPSRPGLAQLEKHS